MSTINPRRTAPSSLGQKAPIPSSSPGFGTPVHPILSQPINAIPAPAAIKPIVPILLPPNLLRPVAVRVFTRNHDLNLQSSALGSLATFIGRHCGQGWREQGLAERVLEEVARSWKKAGGSVIINGDSGMLKDILKGLESCMVGGRIIQGKSGTPSVSRQGSFAFGPDAALHNGISERPAIDERQDSFGMSSLGVEDNEDEEDASKDPRDWLKVIGGFDQPRLVYNVGKRHFEKSTTKPSLLAPPSHRIEMFRQRYHVVHQRILRNEAFQVPTFSANTHKSSLQSVASNGQYNKITPIANLLGRGGSTHLLFGLLTVAPTGTLALSDLTGSIALDLQHARPIPEDGAWFAPGMMALIDGSYEEDDSNPSAGSASALGGTGGIGGTIGGKFVCFSVGHPPVERRNTTLGIKDATADDALAGPAFGWTDFLGVGSERGNGSRMRRLCQRLLAPPLEVDLGTPSPPARSGIIAIASELNLAEPATLSALRTMLSSYSSLPVPSYPLAMVLMGNFATNAALSGASGSGSIEYKESFDSLASLLSEFPQLIARTTLIFVPGDHDAWASAHSAGAAVPLPRKAIPDIFTSRIRRVVAEANREVHGVAANRKGIKEGEAIWTTNPSRLSWFGVAGEMVLLRDDMLGRLRRTAIRFNERDDEAEGEENVAATQTRNAEYSMSGGLPSSPPRQATQDAQSMEVDVTGDEASTNPLDSGVDPHVQTARALAFTLLSQSHLSPFPMSVRPQHWSYGSALSLYPLPNVLVIADSEAPPFALSYAGCAVLNPGRCARDTSARKGNKGARWVEWDIGGSGGRVREEG
ncbi:DNA polymeras-like protein epsilon subunit B [Pseudovirgaria hyperparasitica]|uniref:DNA polymerase epsilon subunit B n=1 Tax=Pseudovirgaria hyperparasitica TaxID=470096 RepID=A0A6A6WDS4_9PEZI|nr:DNA polymeras-like protein epsilon subunit B [Pseudovirgaria hyperparasitica]KAF2760130.1 DNA polymeras-like protein epsilon subunit B [Pseudovirgaria hyperparasitica]